MDTATKNAARTTTPTKDTHDYRSKNQEPPKYAENLNPNNNHTPVSKPLSNSCSSSPSPVVKKSCSKSQKKPQAAATPTAKNNHPNNQIVGNSPQNKIRQRKFVVAKKNNNTKNNKKKEEEGGGGDGGGSTVSFCRCRENKKDKCLCVAYQNLRKSQEEFFKNKQREEEQEDGAAEIESVIQEEEQQEGEDCGGFNELGNVDLAVKRRRERLMEEARERVPQGGPGKVMHLVKAFEKLLSVSTTENKDQDQKVLEKEPQEKEENKVKKKVMRWALPGLPLPNNATETEDVSGSSFYPPQLILTSENLGLNPKASVSSSWDSSRGRFDK